MRTIGLIGGMSWESTAVYYRRLNELVRERLGGLHSARILLHSVDFADIAAMQRAGDWERARATINMLAEDLKRAGADFVVLATNTMHKVADEVEDRAGLPLLHIVDVTVAALGAVGKSRPLLLATRFTMEDGFYRDRLAGKGIDAVVPPAADRDIVHRVIFDELCRGRVEPASKAAFLRIIADARAQGIDSVIFGCTEVGLLLSQADVPELVVDSTEAHVRAAVDLALEGQRPDSKIGHPIHRDEDIGLQDAVSLWRLRNMTEAERLEMLGPPRPRSVFVGTPETSARTP